MAALASKSARGMQLFVSRLHWTVSQDALNAYFQRFGAVQRTQVVFDMKTGFSKGFGFVTMSSPEEVESVLSTNRHELNGLEFVAIRAKPPGNARPATEPATHSS